LIDNQDSNARATFEVSVWAFHYPKSVETFSISLLRFSVLEFRKFICLKKKYLRSKCLSEGYFRRIVSSVTIIISQLIKVWCTLTKNEFFGHKSIIVLRCWITFFMFKFPFDKKPSLLIDNIFVCKYSLL